MAQTKRRRKLKDRIRIGQKLTRRNDRTAPPARIYQVWRKTEQVQIVYPNGGKAIWGMKALEQEFYCPDWYAFDPTQD